MEILFYRDFRGFSGGHLKVWHYFNHVLSTRDHEPWVRFSPTSVWDGSNPWFECRARVLPPDSNLDPDVVFLAGLDWLRLKPRERRRPRRPVVNLIQHVRHARLDDPRFQFLSHPAVRICVSGEVSDAIVATGRVRGPVFVVPNAVDTGSVLATIAPTRDVDVLVVANKQPELGRRMRERLERPGRRIVLLDRAVPREEFLDLLRRTHVALLLPNSTEGFYLPALEAMALGALVVCPDCVGNRSFCLPGLNCLRPGYVEEELAAGVEEAIRLDTPAADHMRRAAAATAAEHDLAGERSRFLDILAKIHELAP